MDFEQLGSSFRSTNFRSVTLNKLLNFEGVLILFYFFIL